MGRHSPTKSRGLRAKSPVIVLSVLLVLVLIGWFTYDFLSDRLRASSCDNTVVLNVTAAPDVAIAHTAMIASHHRQSKVVSQVGLRLARR